MPVAEALAGFDTVIGGARSQPVAAHLDLPAVSAALGYTPAVLRDLVRAPARRPAARTQPQQSTLHKSLAGRSEADRHRLVLERVRAETAAVLGYGADHEPIDDRSFKDMGFDSLTAVDLRNQLTKATGLELPPTLVFTYPTPRVVAQFLVTQLEPAAESPADSVDDELARLENHLAGLPADEELHHRVTKRLEALLWKWRGDVEPDTASPIASAALDSVSDDEMFALIDKQLGAS